MLAPRTSTTTATMWPPLAMAEPHVCAPIDANGNLTADGTRTFEWNGLNQLVAVEINQDRVEFGYNGALQRAARVSKQNDVVQSEFNAVWCDGQTCEERYVGANPWTRRLLNGGEVGAASSLTTLDHLGSIRDVTTSAAVLTDRFEFDPFGRPSLTAGSNEGATSFAGLQPDAISEMWHAQFRAYDPETARWLSEDPSRLSDGPNMFAYVRNRSLTYADPSGLQGALMGPPQVIRTPKLPAACGTRCGCTIFEGDKDYSCKCTDGGYALELWAYASATIYIDSDKFTNERYVEDHERQHVEDFIDVTTRFLRVSGKKFSSPGACERAAQQLFNEFDVERQRLYRSRHGFFQKLMCPF